MPSESHSLPDLLGSIIQRATATNKPVHVTRGNIEGVDFAINAFSLREDPSVQITDLVDELRQRVEAQLPEGVTLSVEGTFLNFSVSNAVLGPIAHNIASHPRGVVIPQEAKKVMVEFCSPNTNKPLHLGHLRNISIGKSLLAMYDFVGDSAVAANVTNDRGVHICKSMLAYLMFGNGETPESTGKKGDHFVGDYYVRYEKALKDDPSLEQKVGEMLQKWEEGDSEIRDLWSTMNTWVYEGFATTLDRLDVHFDANYFESDIYKMGRDIVLQGLADGILEKDDNGAICADLARLGVAKAGKKVLLRPDGTSVYMTQDLALAKLKAEQHALDKSVYVVANEQNDHFKNLFGILNALGYSWAKNDKLQHFSYGMVELPHGRMKSREGTVVDTDDLLNELRSLVQAKASEKLSVLDDHTADLIGIAAAQYFFLSARPETTLKFDPERSLDFEGKTGPYILYQYVRSGRILKQLQGRDDQKPDFSLLKDPQEHALLLKLVEFTDVIRVIQKKPTSMPVAEYVYDLARKFSVFYENCPVLNAPDKAVGEARAALVAYAHALLGEMLDILAIRKPEKM